MEMEHEWILRAIDEFATEGIQVTDAQGNYIFCNQAFSQLSGLPVSERLGRNVLEVQPDGAAATVLKTGIPVYGHVNSSRDGVIMVSNASPIRNREGEIVGVISIFNDRTSYVSLAQSLKEREEEVNRLKGRLRQLNRPNYTFEHLVGQHPAFLECIRRARRAAEGTASVLITGESGTGKELVAQAIHNHSLRGEGPFVRVNCPAIPGNLLESELFGHEKGAFTGAMKEKSGKFELAQGGSIFLDEIGDLDIALQSKLLRVLQEREMERVGGNRVIKLDVRVIAATNQDLGERIAQGRFRKDLYYRLNVIHIHIPPLRDRPSDIPLLLTHLLKKHSQGMIPCSLTQEAVGVCMDYHWPGNVRELENVAERLLLYHEGDSIDREEMIRILGERPSSALTAAGEGQTLAELERQAILRAVKRHGDTMEGKREAARELGISLSGLYRKLSIYRKEE